MLANRSVYVKGSREKKEVIMQSLYLPVLATYNPLWLLHCLDTGQDLVLPMDMIHTLLFKVRSDFYQWECQ